MAFGIPCSFALCFPQRTLSIPEALYTVSVIAVCMSTVLRNSVSSRFLPFLAERASSPEFTVWSEEALSSVLQAHTSEIFLIHCAPIVPLLPVMNSFSFSLRHLCSVIPPSCVSSPFAFLPLISEPPYHYQTQTAEKIDCRTKEKEKINQIMLLPYPNCFFHFPISWNSFQVSPCVVSRTLVLRDVNSFMETGIHIKLISLLPCFLALLIPRYIMKL